MTVLYIFIFILAVIGLSAFCAPEGWEDEDGFHLGRKE